MDSRLNEAAGAAGGPAPPGSDPIAAVTSVPGPRAADRPPGALRSILDAWAPRGPEGAKIARNVSWLIGDRMLRLVAGLAINVWMIRYLGATDLGLLSFSQSLIGLFALFSQLGLESIVVRELVRRPADEGEVLGTALGLRITGAAATLALSAAAMLVLRPHDPQALALALIFASVTSAQSLDVIEYAFQSRSAVAPFVTARAVAFALASAAKVACLIAHASLATLALAVASEPVLAAAALAIAYHTHGAKARWRFATARARALLQASWPLMLSGFAIVLYTRTDQVMLTMMRGEAENGILAAAQRLSEILYFIPVALMTASNPALLRAHQEGHEAYERRLFRLFAMLTWAAIALAVPISLAAGWIVTTLFGPEFRASGPVLALHVWAAPAVFLGVAQSSWFIAQGQERGLLARTLAGALTNVALNVALIPRFGAVGAAAATLISQWLASIALNALMPSTRGLFRLQCRAFLPMAGR